VSCLSYGPAVISTVTVLGSSIFSLTSSIFSITPWLFQRIVITGTRIAAIARARANDANFSCISKNISQIVNYLLEQYY
jgi:hypothetical protein